MFPDLFPEIALPFVSKIEIQFSQEDKPVYRFMIVIIGLSAFIFLWLVGTVFPTQFVYKFDQQVYLTFIALLFHYSQ